MELSEYFNLAAGLLIIFLGIYIQVSGKHNLIAGYKSMSEEQKKNFDIKKYAIFFRNTLMVIGLLIIGTPSLLKMYGLEYYSLFISILIIIVGVLFLNMSGGTFKK